jgi:hypothetical protein
LRVAGLLGRGGDHVEADEGEEDDRRGREQAVDAVRAARSAAQHRQQRLLQAAVGIPAGRGRRDERAVVGRVDVAEPDDDHQEHHADLDRGEHHADPAGDIHAMNSPKVA